MERGRPSEKIGEALYIDFNKSKRRLEEIVL